MKITTSILDPPQSAGVRNHAIKFRSIASRKAKIAVSQVITSLVKRLAAATAVSKYFASSKRTAASFSRRCRFFTEPLMPWDCLIVNADLRVA